MALPVYFGNGLVAIYGEGTVRSIHGITVTPNQFKFGTVYHLGLVNNDVPQIGDVVMFKATETICVLATREGKFTVIDESKIILTEYYT